MDYKWLAHKNGLKVKDLKDVEKRLKKQGNFKSEMIESEMQWFFGELGIGRYYFETTSKTTMARHIESLRAAEIIAENSKSQEVKVDIRSERKSECFYFIDDTLDKTTEIELRIEDFFDSYRLECYRTKGKSLDTSFLRLYFVSKPHFDADNKPPDSFLSNINKEFLATCSDEAGKRYERVYNTSRELLFPYVEISRKYQTKETRILISLPPHSSRDFLSKFSEVLRTYKLYTTRKYVEPMRDGRRLCSFYLPQIKKKQLLDNLKEDISLISLVGETPIDDLFIQGILTAREYLYASCLCPFTHQFMTSYTSEISSLEEALARQPELHGIVRFLKLRLAKDTYTRSRIFEVIRNYPAIVKNLYLDFQQRFDPDTRKTKSRKYLQTILEMLEVEVSRELDKNIIHSFLGFNQMILKTNFYKKDKIAISFRMSPEILNSGDYPETPFGIFYVVGREMKGFHVRFQDIARGGVRIVRSRNSKEYDTNFEFIFEENYRLAHTQQRKNKDIPEGGSKGAILLGYTSQTLGEVAFKKYIDGLLDLLLPDKEIVDYHKSEEILFLGPDEGTAEFMDWACNYARKRNYKFWKSFTTGKSAKLGGIPHDLYGMTTAGVHEYELQILKKMGLKEEDATKIQTGGPDGDLGSNEIKCSKSKYLAVVDATGVLYDAEGIHYHALLRLAKERKPVCFFPRKKISSKGFLVLMEDKAVNLFDGTYVANGTEFRNNFHLSHFAKADLFIPCGGRPQSINIMNWKRLLEKDGTPSFKVIVEGANLFITQDARLELEKKGCIIIKDASANKGGVTSSSLEVLASLLLDSREYDQLFCVKGRKSPTFRKAYIKEVLSRIRQNARREFEILWRENHDNKVPFSILSDRLSEKINNLNYSIYDSELFATDSSGNHPRLLQSVISRYVPAILLEKLGIEEVLSRLPEVYKKSLFAATLARDFVYTHGLHASEVDFSSFLDQLEQHPQIVDFSSKEKIV